MFRPGNEKELPLTLCHQTFMWLTLKSVFLQIANCICPLCKYYLSKLTNLFVQTREGERASSDPLPSNFHVAFHTFTLLSPNIKSTLITGIFLKDFVHEIQHNFCISINNNTRIPSNCQNTQFLMPVKTILISKTPILLKRDELYSVYNF